MSKKMPFRQCEIQVMDNEAKTTYVAYIPSDKAIVGKLLKLKPEGTNLKVLSVSEMEHLMSPGRYRYSGEIIRKMERSNGRIIQSVPSGTAV